MKLKDVPIIIGTMESGYLSKKISPAANLFYSKKGGLGDVIPVLSQGLMERGLDVHIIMPNLESQFIREHGITKKDWMALRLKLPERNIHLIDSYHIEKLPHIYSGNKELTAAIFQAKAAPMVKTIRANAEGKGIFISNDWMTCGFLSAYLGTRGVPVLHMIHNIHTGHISLNDFYDVPLDDFKENFYYSDNDNSRIDSHATGIKNASYTGVVGEAFLQELISDSYPDLVPHAVLKEIKAKYQFGRALSLPNGLYNSMLPENQKELFDKFEGRLFTPETENLLECKKDNLKAFQQATGLNIDENATLLFWPSRLDSFQKGIDLLEETANEIIRNNKDVQIAIVADPSNEKEGHAERLTSIALGSSGQICYYRFNKDLSSFGYSAASIIIGAPTFEPYGYFIPQGLACGDLLVVSKVGGGRDMVKEYSETNNTGNGAHITEHSPAGFYKAVQRGVNIHRYFKRNPAIWEKEIRRFMIESRKSQGSKQMIDGYINVLEAINEEYCK